MRHALVNHIFMLTQMQYLYIGKGRAQHLKKVRGQVYLLIVLYVCIAICHDPYASNTLALGAM